MELDSFLLPSRTPLSIDLLRDYCQLCLGTSSILVALEILHSSKEITKSQHFTLIIERDSLKSPSTISFNVKELKETSVFSLQGVCKDAKLLRYKQHGETKET